MHKTVLDYLQTVKDRYPHYFAGRVVVEYGSKNLNGTSRDLFDAHDYIGVNRDDGKDVDVVSRMHEFAPKWECGVVVTTSTMEHDKYLYLSLDRCWEILAPDGMFVGTTVNRSWSVHHPEEGEDNHYEGVDADEFKTWIEKQDPAEYELLTPNNEIQFYMIKRADEQVAPEPPRSS